MSNTFVALPIPGVVFLRQSALQVLVADWRRPETEVGRRSGGKAFVLVRVGVA